MRLKTVKRYNGEYVMSCSYGTTKRAKKNADNSRPKRKQSLETKNRRVLAKFSNLDYPVEELLNGSKVMVQLTLNNSSTADPELWLRGSEMVYAMRRKLDYIFRDSTSPLQYIWVEEFGRKNKPHVHMVFFVPTDFIPTWKGTVWTDLESLFVRVGQEVILKKQPVAKKGLHSIAHANKVTRSTKRSIVTVIKQSIKYLTKTGQFSGKKSQKEQITWHPSAKVFADDHYTSGYSQLQKSEEFALVETDDPMTMKFILQTLKGHGAWTRDVKLGTQEIPLSAKLSVRSLDRIEDVVSDLGHEVEFTEDLVRLF